MQGALLGGASSHDFIATPVRTEAGADDAQKPLEIRGGSSDDTHDIAATERLLRVRQGRRLWADAEVHRPDVGSSASLRRLRSNAGNIPSEQ
jgi:hypothetical protein